MTSVNQSYIQCVCVCVKGREWEKRKRNHKHSKPPKDDEATNCVHIPNGFYHRCQIVMCVCVYSPTILHILIAIIDFSTKIRIMDMG